MSGLLAVAPTLSRAMPTLLSFRCSLAICTPRLHMIRKLLARTHSYARAHTHWLVKYQNQKCCACICIYFQCIAGGCCCSHDKKSCGHTRCCGCALVPGIAGWVELEGSLFCAECPEEIPLYWLAPSHCLLPKFRNSSELIDTLAF